MARDTVPSVPEVGVTVGVWGDSGDEGADSKLARSKAVAQHIELGFPRELQ